MISGDLGGDYYFEIFVSPNFFMKEYLCPGHVVSWDISVGIAFRYGLDIPWI
jgi:hypothetical protein